LTTYQKNLLAQHITSLHSYEFLTPSLYINVVFNPTEATGDFFLAGKPMAPIPPNRIMATVRTSTKRTKDRFDKFAKKIESAWYEVVNGPKEQGVTNDNVTISAEDKKRRKLHIVAFIPVITALENGIYLPSVSLAFRPIPFFDTQPAMIFLGGKNELIKCHYLRPTLKELG
jgi:hypothetical protein